MVANFRCNEIKEEAIKLITDDIAELEAVCAKSVVEGFGEKCYVIITKATEFFNDSSK